LDRSKNLSDDLFERLIQEGYLPDERDTTPDHDRGDEDNSNGNVRTPLFGRSKYRAPLPPTSTSLSTTAPGSPTSPTIPTPSTLPSPPQPSGTGRGFWKMLSDFDVSTSSAPGQIIIPMVFKRYFPSITSFIPTSSGAKQGDVHFDIIFRDNNGSRRVNNVRLIHYIPSPTHARSNEELRFTFLNRDIQTTFVKNDILIFEKTNDPNCQFIVEKISQGSPRYQQFSSTRKRFDDL